jgi:flagellar FliL protein
MSGIVKVLTQVGPSALTLLAPAWKRSHRGGFVPKNYCAIPHSCRSTARADSGYRQNSAWHTRCNSLCGFSRIQQLKEEPVAEAKKDEAPSHADAAAPAGSSKMMMGVLGLNMALMVAVAVVLFLGQKKQAQQQTLDQVAQGAAVEEKHAPAAAEHGEGGEGGEHGASKAEAPPSDSHFFSVGDFTANLAGPASTHYVKVTVNFEMNKEADEDELKARKPQFRDKVISLLNSKQPSDVQSIEGRNSLKEEIKTVSNTFLKKGKIEGVYFSAFVVN